MPCGEDDVDSSSAASASGQSEIWTGDNRDFDVGEVRGVEIGLERQGERRGRKEVGHTEIVSRDRLRLKGTMPSHDEWEGCLNTRRVPTEGVQVCKVKRGEVTAIWCKESEHASPCVEASQNILEGHLAMVGLLGQNRARVFGPGSRLRSYYCAQQYQVIT
jgi:hypothetical protein